MHTCPLLRASIKPRTTATYRPSPKRPRSHARRWLALSISLLGLMGWQALRDTLNAIPDSNDDFGLF